MGTVNEVQQKSGYYWARFSGGDWQVVQFCENDDSGYAYTFWSDGYMDAADFQWGPMIERPEFL